MLFKDNKSKDVGFFGLLPRGPIRKALFEEGEFKDRKFHGLLMKNSDEARSFRRGIGSAVATGVVLAGYLGNILERLPSA